MSTSAPDGWRDELIDEINTAADHSDALATIFERLQRVHGPEEAGRRWWAAFGAGDASAT